MDRKESAKDSILGNCPFSARRRQGRRNVPRAGGGQVFQKGHFTIKRALIIASPPPENAPDFDLFKI